MGTILGEGFAQAQVRTNHSLSAVEIRQFIKLENVKNQVQIDGGMFYSELRKQDNSFLFLMI